MNLKNYLQKKLTISSKESELLESVFKDYIKKKKQSRMEEVSFDDIKKGVKKAVGKAKSLFSKSDSNSTKNAKDIKAKADFMESILSNSKILSQLKEVGNFFNIFKEEHWVSQYDRVGSHYGMVDKGDAFITLGNLGVSDSIINYAFNYGIELPKNNSNEENRFLFQKYMGLCISYAIGGNYKERLNDYVYNYWHVSKSENVRELENILFTDIYQNVFKENLYNAIKLNFKEQVEDIKRYADSVDRYETRSDTPTERSEKYKTDWFKKITSLKPSTLLKLYLHFYPSSNKFEFKDIFQYTYKGKWDKFISEKKKSKGNTMKLKDYLHKKLTISEKEASFIELAVKEYVQKKKQVKETFPKRKIRNPDYDYNMSSLENDEYVEYGSSYSNDPLADEKPAIPYPKDEEEDFYSRPEFTKNPKFKRPQRR